MECPNWNLSDSWSCRSLSYCSLLVDGLWTVSVHNLNTSSIWCWCWCCRCRSSWIVGKIICAINISWSSVKVPNVILSNVLDCLLLLSRQILNSSSVPKSCTSHGCGVPEIVEGRFDFRDFGDSWWTNYSSNFSLIGIHSKKSNILWIKPERFDRIFFNDISIWYSSCFSIGNEVSLRWFN